MNTKDILKELRKNRNLSAQQVANGCNMSLGVYKKYESGERGVGTPALLKLADFFNVTTDYLLGRPNAQPPSDLIEDFVAKTNMQEQEQIILTKWLALDEKKRQAVFDFMIDIVHEYESKFVQSNAQFKENQIKKIDIQDSKLAIARSSKNNYMPAPTDEQYKSFEELTDDMLGE